MNWKTYCGNSQDAHVLKSDLCLAYSLEDALLSAKHRALDPFANAEPIALADVQEVIVSLDVQQSFEPEAEAASFW